MGNPEPIPADLREAFDHAVDALIAWESGDEPRQRSWQANAHQRYRQSR
jgi:hypothetical protein